MRREARDLLILLAIPSIVLLCAVLLGASAGPYWLGPNYDAAYQYLMNGLYLVKGFPPTHVDHPGTPVQMLCALVIGVFNIGRPAAGTVDRVLIAPEFYLHAVFAVLVILSFLTSVLLAAYVYRRTRNKLAALLVQLPALGFLVLPAGSTSAPIIPVAVHVTPEPCLIVAMNLFNYALLRAFFAATPSEMTLAMAVWGVVCGLAAAVKLTFLPLMVVPLIVLGWRDKILFLVVSVGAFLVWTIPIFSRYPYLWQWASGILTHTGIHGAGGAGFIDLKSFFMNFLVIARQQGAVVFLALAGLGWAAARAIGRKADRATFFLAATACGILLQFMAVAKHPGVHYLVPGLGLSGAFFVFLYLQRPLPARWKKVLAGAIFITVAAGTAQALVYRTQLEGYTRDVMAFHARVREKYNACVVIPYYGASGQDVALSFGDGSYMVPRFAAEMARLYPDSIFLHLWSARIMAFDFKARLWSDDLLAQSRCVVLDGIDYDFSPWPLQVQALEKGPSESLYRVTGTLEQQAAIAFSSASRALQAGDGARALEFAAQARQLHFQPAVALERLTRQALAVARP